MNVQEDNIYPLTPMFTLEPIQRAAYPHLSSSTSSLDVPESPCTSGVTRDAASTTPARKNLYEYIFHEIKEWFDKFLRYLFL